jgi:bacteriocin-type transport-associated protein
MSALLKELCNQDIDWLLANGMMREVPSESVLLQSGQPVDHLFIVLEGGLSVSVALQGANGDPTELELTRLPQGEFWGSLPGLTHFLPPAQVKALLPTRLFAVSGEMLKEKIGCDRTFAAHLYQTAAQLLSNRLNSLAQRLGYSLGLLSQLQLKEAATVFGALQDSDLDWLIAVGQFQTLEKETVLVQRGRPLEQLHMIVEGAVGLSAPEQAQAPMLSAFNPARDSEAKEFARLSRGNLVGEMIFVETYPPLFTARTLRETQVLSIPRWRLMTRLLYEPDFAARLYQVLAVLLANKQHSILQQLGLGQGAQELDHDLLAQMSLAEARFDWMVKRLQTQAGNRR